MHGVRDLLGIQGTVRPAGRHRGWLGRGRGPGFAGNGFRCPRTDVAEHLGAEQASVTDAYLPRWFADNLPAIHVPLILLAAFLHGDKHPPCARCGVS
jgi:hypothetical protein